MLDYRLLYLTVAIRATGRQLARRLVQERLAPAAISAGRPILFIGERRPGGTERAGRPRQDDRERAADVSYALPLARLRLS